MSFSAASRFRVAGYPNVAFYRVLGARFAFAIPVLVRAMRFQFIGEASFAPSLADPARSLKVCATGLDLALLSEDS